VNAHTPSRVAHETVSVGGAVRSFTVLQPAWPTASVPGILLFHASTQSGEKFRAFTGNLFDRCATQSGALLAYLDGFEGHWNDARSSVNYAAHTANIDDVGFACAVIDALVTRFGADAKRVYVSGYSNGGHMVIRLVHEIPECLAGAAVMCATQPVPQNFAPARDAKKPLATVLMHGTKDPLVPYAGGVAKFSRVPVLSAPATAAYYAARNHITASPIVSAVASRTRTDRCTVEQSTYRQEGKAPVVLYTIRGGGHTIPGTKPAPLFFGPTATNFDAAAEISAFFGLI
jgi:polyhydroxybutyrate depolymerase